MKKFFTICLVAVIMLGSQMMGTMAESAEMSDDIYSFQIMLDGTIYQFPMRYADFIAYGWVDTGDATEKLAPDSYMTGGPFVKDNTKIYVTVFNLGINTMPVSECYLGGISLDAYYLKDSTMEIVFPKNITVGKATRADIESAYGPASNVYEGSSYVKLTYEYASYQDIELQIDNETGVLNQGRIRNIIETEEMSQNPGEVSDEVPEVVTQYVAPTELGDDITSFVVDYAGALYRIPAPVSTFISNGWTVMPEDVDAVVKGSSTSRITLMKDNQQLRAYIRNYSENATRVQNCLVTYIQGNENTTNVSITLPKGITRDMHKADLEAALEGVTYKTEESASYIYYTIVSPYSNSDTIQILLNKESDTVTGITVDNSPKLTVLYK